jgi:ankyrin repeat protein
MFSIKKADLKLMRTILNYKPDINAKDSKNRNGLFYGINTSIGDNPEFIIELIKNGINVNEPEIFLPSENIEGHSPLTLAAKLNYKNIVKILLENSADPNYQVKSNLNSCLHYAILKNNEDMTKILIESKANINILNKNDDTPINMALKGSNVFIYWLLANENEKFRIQKEVTKMIQESENIDNNNCSIENLKIFFNLDKKAQLNSNEGKSLILFNLIFI